jgi:hypothetical protein
VHIGRTQTHGVHTRTSLGAGESNSASLTTVVQPTENGYYLCGVGVGVGSRSEGADRIGIGSMLKKSDRNITTSDYSHDKSTISCIITQESAIARQGRRSPMCR